MTEIAPRIAVDEKVCHGKPVIRGTRVLVEVVLGTLAAGNTPEQIAAEYDIEREDVLAAVQYAAALVAGEELKATGS